MHVNRQLLRLFLALVIMTWSLASWPPSVLGSLPPNEARVTRVNWINFLPWVP